MTPPEGYTMLSSARWIACLVAGMLVAPLTGCGAEVAGREPDYPEPVGYTPPSQVAAADPAPSPVPYYQGEPQPVATSEQGGELGTGPEVAIGADPPVDEYEDNDPAALTDFQSELQPYGDWRDDPTYGTVWTPSAGAVGSDFKPYVSAGHWVYDSDYTWVSDYSWGWAPFHYGRWVYVGGYGWSWIPGRVYSGAWVSWRYGYDDYGYVGWAPLPPRWGWFHGRGIAIAVVPPAPYVFCGSRYMFRHGVGGYLVTGSQVPVVAARTRPYVPAAPVVAGSAGYGAARPVVGGPAPSLLHVPPAEIARPSVSDQGRLARAQQFARPSTASAAGVRPSVGRSAPVAGFASPGVPAARFGGPRPVYTPPPQVRGSLGVPPAQNTPYRAPPTALPQYRAPSAPSYSGRPTYVPPSGSFPSSRPPVYSSPSQSPRFSPPPQRSPSFQSSPSFRSGPSIQSSPSFQAPRPSAPVSRPSSRPSTSRPSAAHGIHR